MASRRVSVLWLLDGDRYDERRTVVTLRGGQGVADLPNILATVFLGGRREAHRVSVVEVVEL